MNDTVYQVVTIIGLIVLGYIIVKLMRGTKL